MILFLQGNCPGPPTPEQARKFNLSVTAAASLNKVRRGQCVIIVNKATFFTAYTNKWFDDLYIAYESDTLVSGVATAISVRNLDLFSEIGPNTFLTRVTFHALGGFQAAQVLAIPPFDPVLLDRFHALPGQLAVGTSGRHSILFQGANSHRAMHICAPNRPQKLCMCSAFVFHSA